MTTKFLGKGKMIGEVTYWAPPIWKFWKWKLRHRIISDAKYCAKELAAGRELYADILNDPETKIYSRKNDDIPPWER